MQKVKVYLEKKSSLEEERIVVPVKSKDSWLREE